MKICAIICEYNPFHNGHLYQLREAKRLSGADALLCIMSGNFVQRGEAAVMDKYTRARHAVLAGADIVIELPTPFATSNAELFAKGAIHLLSSIPAVTTLCFGAENADKQALLSAANALNSEPTEISLKIKEEMAKGVSYARAHSIAWQGVIPEELLTNPNNILALEYAKAILLKKAVVNLLPIERIGGGYKEKKLRPDFASATAIRATIADGKSPQNALPNFVIADLPNALETRLDTLEKYAIFKKTPQEIAKTCDCTEGLENALKKAADLSSPLEETLTSARYTSARIRRIALQNLLDITEEMIRNCLTSPLYLRVLAAKKDCKALLGALSQSTFPLLARAHDEDKLQGSAKFCFQKDLFAEKIYRLLYSAKRKTEIFI